MLKQKSVSLQRDIKRKLLILALNTVNDPLSSAFFMFFLHQPFLLISQLKSFSITEYPSLSLFLFQFPHPKGFFTLFHIKIIWGALNILISGPHPPKILIILIWEMGIRTFRSLQVYPNTQPRIRVTVIKDGGG